MSRGCAGLRIACAGAVLVAAASGDAQADSRLLGLNIHQSADVGVAVTAGCKGQLVRIDFNWYSAEVSQGTFDWSVLDAVVNAAAAHGFTIIATTGYTPAWAATAGQDDSMNNAVPVAGSYAAFVTAAVQHFAGRVGYWELWNEPNLTGFFQGTPTDYVNSVLLPGAAAVHAACSTCSVLAPAIATVGSNYADWMQAVLTQAGSSIDVVSGHDYAAFDDMGGGGANPDFFSKLDNHRVVKVNGSVVYEDPLSLRESMNAYGAAGKDLWITETGYQATYGDLGAEVTQAKFAREVLEAMTTRPWWTATAFYEAFDVSGQPYHWGFALADPDASVGYDPKPVCAVLAKPPDWDAAIPPEASTDDAAGTDAAGDGSSADGGADATSDADATSTRSSSRSGCTCGTTSAHAPRGAGPVLLAALLLVSRRARRGRARGRAMRSAAPAPRPSGGRGHRAGRK